MSAHTPGPWEVAEGKTYINNKPMVTEVFVRVPGGDVAIAAEITDGGDGEISHANARLIAAAPDLYESALPLKQDLEVVDGLLDDEAVTLTLTGRELKALCAAIAKVEGKS